MNNFVCKKCGAKHNYTLQETTVGTGIATGLYCSFCGAWQKWIGQKELKELASEALQYKRLKTETPSEEEKTIDERIEELKKTIAALQDLKERFKTVREKREQGENKNQDFVPDLDSLPEVDDNPPWDD